MQLSMHGFQVENTLALAIGRVCGKVLLYLMGGDVQQSDRILSMQLLRCLFIQLIGNRMLHIVCMPEMRSSPQSRHYANLMMHNHSDCHIPPYDKQS